MSELVTFLREEVAAQHYARVLRQRCFTHWKFAQSKYHPMPLSRGTLAAAAFRWLLTSFGDDALAAGGLGQGGLGQGIAAKNLFPFYAAVEQGGAEGGAFFLSRLRSYMTDRLSLPPQNLPLLAHAVALFDAHQLTQCFSKWARFQRRCRQLDVFCFEQRARRLLRLWAGRAGKSALHRRRVQLLRRRVAQRSARHWLSLWQALFRAVRFRRGVRAPRSKGQALLALRRLLTGRRLARLCLTSATRFRHGRGLRLATLRLQQRLCGVRMGEADFARALRRPQLLHAWLVHVVRGWEGSQRAMCETVRRCQWIRMHRFTARLATSASFAHSGARGGNGWGSGGRDGGRGGADSRSARSRRYDSCDSDDPDDEGGGQRHRDEFSTPQRQRKERWVGQGSGSDMGNTGPPLSLSLLSPDDLSAARRAPHSHIDSHTDSHIDSHISGGHSGNQSPSRGRGSAPSAAEAAAAQDGDAAAVAAVALTLLSRLQASLGSRQSQGALLQCAATFRRLRCLLRAVRRWQYRVPQVQLDDPDAIALCFPATAQGAQQLRTLTLQMACGRGGDSEGGQGRGRQGRGLAHLYFAAFKRQHRAWGRWRDRSKNNRVATAAGLQLGGRTVALRQTFAFGAWLVTTGRFQQLRRTANRVLCNRFGKELWTAFFAWRHHFERVLLVRCNDRDLLRLKQEEIERFCEGRELRDSRSSQAVALRDWALHVRGLRRLRLIAGLWHATAGKRHLMAAWHTWRLLLGLDLIATCLKKIFRGFRVRRRLQPSARRVAYLQVFARNMPLYTAFRRLAMKRCVFGVLVRHHLQRHLLSTATMRVFLLRRAIRRLQRGALRSHTQRRDMRSARAQRVVLALTAAVRVLGRRHRRLRFLARVRQVARLQVYRRMVRLLHASCLIRRQKRLHHRHYRRQALLYTLRYMHAWHLRQQTRLSFRRRCVHFLMRRGVRRLRHWARVHVRLRRWALTRAHRGARGVLRRWAASARHKRGQAGMADKLYRMRRFRLWFRWWLRESLRHSKLMRRLRQDRGGVGGDGTVLFYMAQRGGRHFSIVRGVISSRVRWHLRKFSKFTSFRRRGRALAGYLMQRWVTLRLSRAFQRLHLFWHRGRGRGRRRGGLGRRLGQGGRGLSDPWGGPHSLHSLHSHTFPQARRREAGPPHAHGSHSTYGTWSGYDAPHQHGGGGNDANSRRYRNHGLVGVRHQVARSSPSTRQEVLQRLHENVTHLPEQNQLRRGFAGWQDFCRYNARNGRALQRLGAEYWRRVARSALQRMHSLLLRRRTRKALVQRLHRSQGSQAMRMFLQRTHLGARRRLRLFRALVLHVSSRDRRAKKALFRRLYSACFFNRYALRLRCTAKLRAAVRGAVRRLRFVAWHHLRSPAALAIRRMDLQRQRHALGRLRGLLEKGSYRAGIYKACARHRCVMSALLVLRQWHRLVRLRQRVQRCVRRLAIRPPLKLWYQLTFDIVRERSIVTHSLRSIHGRAKREILRRWGAWASRTSRLRTQAEMLQGRVRLGCKREALYAWLRAIDQQVCMGKFQRVAQLARRSAVQACFALWHRSALLSELSTWRSGRTALRNWVVSAYWTQRRRIALRRAEAFCCTYPMQVALFVWYRGVRAVVRRRGRAYNAHRLRTLKAYLLHFRRWKRRMHIACWVGRLRLRSCGAFTAHRAMLKWWTAVRRKVGGSHRRVLRSHLLQWRGVAFRSKFARHAFAERLSLFRRRLCLSTPFNALVLNCQTLRLQRTLLAYTRMQTQSRLWHFWRRLAGHRVQERAGLELLIHVLYRDNVHRYFNTWRVRSRIFQAVGLVSVKAQLWGRWRRLFAASMLDRRRCLRRCLGAWRGYLASVSGELRLLLRRRRRIWGVVIRRLRVDLLRMAIALRRWHTGDDSVRLCQYWRHTDWLHAEGGGGGGAGVGAGVSKVHTTDLHMPHPHLAHLPHLPHPHMPLPSLYASLFDGLYHELGASQAGAFLTSASATAPAVTLGMGVGEGEEGQPHHTLQLGGGSRRVRRPAPRLQAIQAHLQRRFQGGGEGGEQEKLPRQHPFQNLYPRLHQHSQQHSHQQQSHQQHQQPHSHQHPQLSRPAGGLSRHSPLFSPPQTPTPATPFTAFAALHGSPPHSHSLHSLHSPPPSASMLLGSRGQDLLVDELM